MLLSPQHFRIFVASPNDVAEERRLALDVIDKLPNRPSFRDRVTLRPIAWDKLGAGTPMLATMTPQEAINSGLAKPSECDIVVVIFWVRMGTPLPERYKKQDGSRHRSGTEWEYWDAFNAAKTNDKPKLLVYRRTEQVLLDDRTPDYGEKLVQQRLVQEFFEDFKNPDGSIERGYNRYEKPEEFKEQFESHLESVVVQFLRESAATQVNDNWNERRNQLYILLAELKTARSTYIRFSRGDRRRNPDEHQHLISVAQGVCTRASKYDDKPCPVEGIEMIIPPYATEGEVARFKAIDNECRDRLRYIADIWLTVNQVTKRDNYAEYLIWGEYEDRNMNALEHGLKRIEALIDKPTR